MSDESTFKMSDVDPKYGWNVQAEANNELNESIDIESYQDTMTSLIDKAGRKTDAFHKDPKNKNFKKD